MIADKNKHAVWKQKNNQTCTESDMIAFMKFSSKAYTVIQPITDQKLYT